MKRKKINKELKFGALIISFYLIWAISWYLFSHFIEGSLFRPYLPFSDIRMELVPPLSKSYLLGTDIYGRSLFEILSSGLNYSLTIGIVVTSLCTFFGVIIGYLSVTGNNIVRVLSDLVTNLIFPIPIALALST
jgi:ABC-type dipeptide/oligopeptide/nickel transport system permease subunit